MIMIMIPKSLDVTKVLITTTLQPTILTKYNDNHLHISHNSRFHINTQSVNGSFFLTREYIR